MPDGPMLYLDRELPADMMAVLGPRANLTGPGEDALTRGRRGHRRRLAAGTARGWTAARGCG